MPGQGNTRPEPETLLAPPPHVGEHRAEQVMAHREEFKHRDKRSQKGPSSDSSSNGNNSVWSKQKPKAVFRVSSDPQIKFSLGIPEISGSYFFTRRFSALCLRVGPSHCHRGQQRWGGKQRFGLQNYTRTRRKPCLKRNPQKPCAGDGSCGGVTPAI